VRTGSGCEVNRWSGWTQIPGGAFNSGLAITSPSANELDVYGRGLDNQVWKNHWSSGTDWDGWSPLGGDFTSKPSAVSFGTGNLAVVGKGGDNAIWIRVDAQAGSTTNWLQIPGGPFDTAPAIARTTSHLYLFAGMADEQLYWTRNDVGSGTYTHSNWSDWEVIPNSASSSAPAAVGTHGGARVAVVEWGLDNSYYLNSYDGVAWGARMLIPAGTFLSEPAVSSWGSGDHLNAFGRGADNHIWANTLDGGTWNGWRQIPAGTFISGPAAWSWGVGHIVVVGRGFDSAAWFSTYQD